MLGELPTCACCLFPGLALFALLALGAARGLRRLVPPSWTLGRRGSTLLYYGTAAFVGALALVIGALSAHAELRDLAFARLCERMSATASPELKASKCAAIDSAAGRVLELGPGPGANFGCLRNVSAITHWTGIEPNLHFERSLAALALPFPTELRWLAGEELDVEAGSYDTAISTHVLCSVDDVRAVLRQVGRALRPGGRLLFFEHVATPTPDAQPLLDASQTLSGPLLNVIGNGCTYRRQWEDLAALETDGGGGWTVELEHYEERAMPLPPLWPHIRGVATKRG